MVTPRSRFSWNRLAMLVLGVGGLVVLGWQLWYSYSGQQLGYHKEYAKEIPKDLIGILLPDPKKLQPLTLTDQNNQPFNLDRVTGKWTFLFFGYTHCPDVCPLSMGLLAEVFAQLQSTPNALQSVQGVFVTVDPERDTPQQLKGYLPYFHPDFLGLTGPATAIQALAKQLNAYYTTTSPTDATDQTEPIISHSSTFFLLDPQGRFAALLQPQLHPPASMADLFRKIRQFYGDLP